MGIPALPDDGQWADEIAPATKDQRNATISIYDPKSPPVLLIKDRAARFQEYRLPETTTTEGAFQTRRLGRFEIEIDPADPLILKGMVVRVTNGGRDATLVNFAFQVYTAVGSSHAGLRNIEVVSELAPVPPVTP